MDAMTTRSAIAHRYAVRGMTCGSCARHVEVALEHLPGVRAAHVDFAAGAVVVEADEGAASFEAMRGTLADVGYSLVQERGRTARWPLVLRPILFGVLAAAGLLSFYLGLITLAQGWAHAIEQLSDDRWFVGAIAAGFGTQVGLFFYLRGLHGRATASGVAASTGTSTAAMLACCAHHLTDVLPVIGLSGAAVFLNVYKTPLLWLGIIMNAMGIAYMLWQIRRQRAMAPPIPEHREPPPVLAGPKPPSAGGH